MHKRFTCRAGHSWDIALDGRFDLAAVVCPVCGAPAETAVLSDVAPPPDGSPATGDLRSAQANGCLEPAATSADASHPDPSGGFPDRRAPPARSETRRYVDDATGQSIGPYRLLQKIGEGGMGSVYMAEQQQPVRRRAALKIIKPGMDSAQIIARFESERQALALMDHQNIARVLDAGATETGRPYFVMELIKGGST